MIAATFGGNEILMLIAILALLVLLILLAIAETAINRISLPKAEALDHELNSKSSAALLDLVREPEQFINPVLVTVTAAQTGQTFLVSLLVARLTDGWVGPLIAFVVNVIVLFVIAESMPKTWAVVRSERAALLSARPTRWLSHFPPLRFVARALIGITNVLLPGKGLKQGPFVSERELLGIVHAAAQDEVIEHEERELIESIIEFGDTVAREVMVPRPDIVFMRDDDTVAYALDKAIRHGFSRLPVRSAHEDEYDVVGVAYLKDLVRAEREGEGQMKVGDITRPVRYIPETKPLPTLMREMQADKAHMAMVVDEYGAIAGLVTLEDVLEELVGEIVDEYDREDTEVERLPDGTFLIDGRMSIDEVNDLIGADLPDEDWDTVAGFVFATLGHVPRTGEAVDFDGWRFAADLVEGRRIRRVRVTPIAAAGAPAEAG
jgi:CBS domain containing-hemolysin-like protein